MRPSWRPASLLLALVLLLGAGFGWFVASTQSRSAPLRADGIVVLTGGADRVAAGLRLLAEGRGRILLVSGVGGAAEFADLARQAGADRALESRVTLGRIAESTYGNALETAAWARARNLASLLVVTSDYHMPRAIAELSRALPGVALYPAAVSPRSPGRVATWGLLAAEYTKFLAAEAGLSPLIVRTESAWRAKPGDRSDPAGIGQQQQTERGGQGARAGG